MEAEKVEVKYEYYFAIASMMNMTSINNREIFPAESYPAVCLDYCLVWAGGGMANAFPVDGESFHGVVHKITEDEMLALDKIESSY